MQHPLSRLLPLLVALALAAISCSDASQDQSATADVSQTPGQPKADNSAADAVEAPEPQPQALSPTPLLLPDPQRWVVVQDWSASEVAGLVGPDGAGGDLHGLQLDVAPLDNVGVPELGRRISLSYRRGTLVDFDNQWGDASSMGEPLEFEIENGFGRSVHNSAMGFSTAQIWNNGTFVSIQTMDPDADLIELARSVTQVSGDEWVAARAGAEDQRLAAIQAAMRIVGPVARSGAPLPHWVLPEPWEVDWVTDMTIWTPEQHAQSAAFSEANRPVGAPQIPGAYHSWQFGFADTAEEAATQFVPQIAFNVLVYDDDGPDPMHPTNYDKISALGLDGVISPIGGMGAPSMMVELGTASVRANIQTSNLGEDGVKEFLDAIEFASDDPLDGLAVSDPRFQPIDLTDWETRPPNWHAAWNHPQGGQAVISVWRLSIPELRTWMMSRGGGLDVPDDVWETVAAEGEIDFGHGTTYDVSVGLLIALRGIEKDELIPIGLDDWITLVEPVNTDPVGPR